MVHEHVAFSGRANAFSTWLCSLGVVYFEHVASEGGTVWRLTCQLALQKCLDMIVSLCREEACTFPTSYSAILLTLAEKQQQVGLMVKDTVVDNTLTGSPAYMVRTHS